ncbi:MAG: efflux RND transporter periplasmic adaptor subunit, partial [Bryobacteraceae bacterium]
MTRADMSAVAALALAALMGGCRTAEEQPVKTEFRVRVARAEAGEAVMYVTAPATLFARQEAVVAARVTAPVAELHVRKGDRVSAGQPLARLESRDLEAQRDEARAAVADAEASLAKLEAGTLPGDVERARGQLTSARAALEQAEKFYQRRRRLYEEGAIPQRDLLISQTELEQARAAFQVAQNAYELLLRQTGQRDI